MFFAGRFDWKLLVNNRERGEESEKESEKQKLVWGSDMSEKEREKKVKRQPERVKKAKHLRLTGSIERIYVYR